MKDNSRRCGRHKMFHPIKILLLLLLLSGCSTMNTTSTITDAEGRVHTYNGPKDVEMSVKAGKDVEIRYSGKAPSFWSEMLKYFILLGSDTNK